MAYKRVKTFSEPNFYGEFDYDIIFRLTGNAKKWTDEWKLIPDLESMPKISLKSWVYLK